MFSDNQLKEFCEGIDDFEISTIVGNSAFATDLDKEIPFTTISSSVHRTQMSVDELKITIEEVQKAFKKSFITKNYAKGKKLQWRIIPSTTIGAIFVGSDTDEITTRVEVYCRVAIY